MSNNQESFLNHVAERLGRERIREEVPHPTYVHDVVHTTLSGKTQDELLEIAKASSAKIHTDLVETSLEGLSETLQAICHQFGDESVLIADDPRFSEYGLEALPADNWPNASVKVWQKGDANRKENIVAASEANIAIAFAEFLLAESGSVVVESSPEQGRSLHFLPVHYIAVIPKSKIVPRSTQAAEYYDQKEKNGEQVGSSINFISGPSNSGDIEMQLVVGVHGPIEVTYVVVLDK
ncbi:LutC/YkgG family protein [Listeria kieliensis]